MFNNILKRWLLVAFALCLCTTTFGQKINAFYIGHSLSDQIPDMVKSLSNDHESNIFNWAYQWIPGAPLRWQWQRKTANDYNPNPPYYIAFFDSVSGLASGKFNTLVLTESVPRSIGRWGIEETYQYADSFLTYAYQFNPNLKVYIYEVWHCLLSGTPTACDYDTDANPWRQRLTDDLPMWQSVADTLNKRFSPEQKIEIIPAGQALARLYDSIQAGVIPDVPDIETLFSDNIHLTDIGKYFVACVHFSTFHRTSPLGLTNQLKVWWGGNFNAPSLELAKKMQEIAWATVYDFFNDTPETSIQSMLNPHPFHVLPNPADQQVHIEYEGYPKLVRLYDTKGILLMESKQKTIDISNLPKGLYFIEVDRHIQKLIKQ
jgi:hypothetical protein